ncbi:hypothetical protein BDP27DRAFT_1370017 [Rhodocollybia butyracea]|uniref:Uncharacterized protein n=1 Tax=Rhodocollybia butyracea TaxID=206335 RepID=A0A9P5PFB0_9AGAR|nr:hypothetical protein BDP27DRAFT_1370017 [Rhodocollybia butyracea]
MDARARNRGVLVLARTILQTRGRSFELEILSIMVAQMRTPAPALSAIPEAADTEIPNKPLSSGEAFCLSTLSALTLLSSDSSPGKSPVGLSTPPKWRLPPVEPKNPGPATVLPSAPELFSTGSPLRPRPKFALSWRPVLLSPVRSISAPVYTSSQLPDTPTIVRAVSDPLYMPEKKFSPMTGWGTSGADLGSKHAVPAGTGSSQMSSIQDVAAAVLASQSPLTSASTATNEWNEEFQAIGWAAEERLQAKHANADGSEVHYADPVMPNDFEEALHAGTHLQNGFNYPVCFGGSLMKFFIIKASKKDSIVGSPAFVCRCTKKCGYWIILNTIFRRHERDMLIGIYERTSLLRFLFFALLKHRRTPLCLQNASSTPPEVEFKHCRTPLHLQNASPTPPEVKFEHCWTPLHFQNALSMPPEVEVEVNPEVKVKVNLDLGLRQCLQISKPLLTPSAKCPVLVQSPSQSPVKRLFINLTGESTDDEENAVDASPDSIQSSMSHIKPSSKILPNRPQKFKKLNNGKGEEVKAQSGAAADSDSIALRFPLSLSPTPLVATEGKFAVLFPLMYG